MLARIELLITDLDNTLYDWVTYFATSFYEMVDAAKDILAVDSDVLLDELRNVHQIHHNSEQPFALLETPTVARAFPRLNRRERYEQLLPAFNRFECARNHTLRPYPHVAETLDAVRSRGVEVVGHTEATVTNARFRLTKLGLTPAVDRLYASENAGEGHPVIDRARPLDELKFVRRLRRDERKPDPRVLLDICEDCGAAPSSALYVGDSLSGDIGMANDAGVWSAWAEYGTHFDPDDWARLVRVTHWAPEDIERAEFAKREHRQAQPDVVLQAGLRDILEYFEFVRPTQLGEK